MESIHGVSEVLPQSFWKMKIALKTNEQTILEQKMENKEISSLLFLELGLSMYKIYNHTYPSAISSFFSSNSRSMSLRSRNRLYSSTPRIQTTKQALGHKGPYIWRHIPDFVKYKNESIEEFRSFADFKNNLRTFILTAGIHECSRVITGILNPTWLSSTWYHSLYQSQSHVLIIHFYYSLTIFPRPWLPTAPTHSPSTPRLKSTSCYLKHHLKNVSL